MNDGLAQSIWLNGLILIGKSFNFNDGLVVFAGFYGRASNTMRYRHQCRPEFRGEGNRNDETLFNVSMI